MEIKKSTIAEAHEAAVKELLLSPEIEIETSPGKWEKTWELDESLMLIIENPLKEHMVSEAVMFGPKSMNQYRTTFVTLTPPRADGKHATYTYGNRLCDYPVARDECTAEGSWAGNGTGEGLNQYDTIIERLKKNPESRRAVMITWVPEIDAYDNEPPCCQNVHIMIRNNKVHGKFLFRSRDGLSAMGENLPAEAYFLEHITNRLNRECQTQYEIGTLTDVSDSFHMYWKRDASELKEMKRVLRVS